MVQHVDQMNAEMRSDAQYQHKRKYYAPNAAVLNAGAGQLRM